MTRFNEVNIKMGLVVLLIFYGNLSFSQYKTSKHGTIVTYRGNVFEFPGVRPPDTVVIVDPETGKEMVKVSEKIPLPIKMNGNKIYWEDSIETTFGMHIHNAGYNAENIREYLVENLMVEFKHFPDGNFYFDIFNIVIDTNGKIVYFEFEGIKEHNFWVTDPSKPVIIDKRLQQNIIKKVGHLLDNTISRKSATVNNNTVPCLITNYEAFYQPVVIKNHKVIKI